MTVIDSTLAGELRDHMVEDEHRFDRLENSITSVSGKLTILIAVVVGSGVLNWFHG